MTNIFIRTENKIINLNKVMCLSVRSKNASRDASLYADDTYIESYASTEEAMKVLDKVIRQIKNTITCSVIDVRIDNTKIDFNEVK